MPRARGAAVGLYVTSYYIGGSVGGILPAPLWSHFGWPGVVALIALAGVISVTLGQHGFRHHAATLRQHAARQAAIARSELRSEEHKSELQSLMRISYAVFCLKKKKRTKKK